jgi:chromosome segregation ATPase
MNRALTYRKRLIFGICAMLLVQPALAADKPSKDETRRLQQQLRKAEQDKTQLVQQKADAENQLKDSEAKAAEAESRAAASGNRSARLKKEIETIKAEKETLAATSASEQAALAAKLTESERKLVEQRQENQRLDAAFARQKTALSTCSERNATLHKLGNEVLDKYEQKGCLNSVLEAEPFTQLQRAKLENLLEDYRDKFDSNKLGP